MPRRIRVLASLIVLTLSFPHFSAAAPPATEPVASNPAPAELLPALEQAARSSTLAWERLAHLTDRIGARLSSTPAMRKAVEWAVATFRADGHENDRTEAVLVPDWRRGRERARLLAPVERELPILGLGGSVDPAGIEAPVVVARSFAELGPHVAGTIVVFNVPMAEGVPTIQHYGAPAPLGWSARGDSSNEASPPPPHYAGGGGERVGRRDHPPGSRPQGGEEPRPGGLQRRSRDRESGVGTPLPA